MADGLNKVFLIGNLAADAELKDARGTPLAKFRIGCTKTYFDKNRQKQEKTEWVQCVLWGKRASGLSAYLNKGTRVLVEGELETNSYEDRDGNKRYSTQVVVNDLKLLGGKRGRSEGSGGGGGGGGGGGSYADEDYGPRDTDDDIPFIFTNTLGPEKWFRVK